MKLPKGGSTVLRAVAVERAAGIQCGMTGRQKIQQALSRDGTPEIPVVICCEEVFVRDHWGEITREPWWAREDADLDRQMQWRTDAIRAIGQDWFEVPLCTSRTERANVSIVERGGEAFRVDRLAGMERRLERQRVGGWDPGAANHSVRPVRVPRTPEEVDEAIPLPGGEDAGDLPSSGRADLARALLDGAAGELFPVSHVSSPLWLCYGLWGFEEMMAAVAGAPDLVARACERFLARSLERARLAAALGAEGIWIEECLTDLTGPDAFSRLAAPYLRRLIEGIHSLGMAAIYYYCGNPAPVWGAILSLPYDALSLEESKKGFRIDIKEVVDRVGGRACVLGNLDAITLLEHGSEEALRAEIGRQISPGEEVPRDRPRPRSILSAYSPRSRMPSAARIPLAHAAVMPRLVPAPSPTR